MHLARFPRVFLAHLSTPLEPMERLSKELGVEIWIKRDDCTGMSTSGNKTRKLEFLMAEALEQGADMVKTQGATQTNHGRQTAAFAAKLGLKCHILLEDRTGYQDGNYNTNGNEASIFVHTLHKDIFAAQTQLMLSHVNVGTGEDVTIRDLAETVKEVVGFTGNLVFDTSKPDGPPRKLMDVEVLSNLGWTASVGLRDGLRHSYQDFLNNQNIRCK